MIVTPLLHFISDQAESLYRRTPHPTPENLRETMVPICFCSVILCPAIRIATILLKSRNEELSIQRKDECSFVLLVFSPCPANKKNKKEMELFNACCCNGSMKDTDKYVKTIMRLIHFKYWGLAWCHLLFLLQVVLQVGPQMVATCSLHCTPRYIYILQSRVAAMYANHFLMSHQL